MKNNRFSYEDQIFENRNKSYGAYDLRVNYELNLMRSFFIGIGSLTVIFFIIYIANFISSPDLPETKETSRVIMDKVYEFEKNIMDNIQPIVPPKKTNIVAPPVPPKPVIEPNAYQIVRQITEPAIQPVEPLINPEPVEPLAGSLSGTGPAAISTVPISSGSGINSISTVLSSAVVDKQPMFPGGMEGFYKFLSNHIRFPEEAKREGISAKLFVSFVINKDGNLVEIEFVKKAGYGMEESVTAVLEKSPKWIPGQVGKDQVSTRMILPVNFNLVQ